MPQNIETTDSNTQLNKMSSRVIDIVETELSLNLLELSKKLGYKNQSPLTKLKQGKGFIGADKLRLLAEIKTERGGTPNINWVLTGKGEKMLYLNKDKSKADQIIDLLGAEKLNKLIEILKNHE